MNVYLPKDRVTNQHQQYGFVEFRSEEDADYVGHLLLLLVSLLAAHLVAASALPVPFSSALHQPVLCHSMPCTVLGSCSPGKIQSSITLCMNEVDLRAVFLCSWGAPIL